MNIPRKSWIWMCIILLSPYSMVLGQSKPEPPKRTGAIVADSSSREDDRKLPQIDLPEFMITGNETMALPEGGKSSYDDQPLFEPRPDMSSPGRDVRSPQLGYGAKEKVGFISPIEGFSGKVTAGYASYTTPFFDGWFGKDFGSADFLLKAGYKSSTGFSRNTDFRTGYGLVSGGTYLPQSAGLFAGARVHGSFKVSGDTYYPYGSITPNQQRSVNRFSSSVSLNSDIQDLFSYSSTLHIRSTSLVDLARSREIQVGMDFSAARDIEGIDAKGDLGLWTSFYDSPSKLNNPLFVQGGLSGRYHVLTDLDLTGGLGMYIMRGSDANTKAKLYPRIGVSWYVDKSLTVFARFEPYVQRADMSQLIETNPYLVNDIGIRHPEYFVHFSTGVETELARNVKANAVLQYKRVRNFAAFLDRQGSGLWNVDYSGITRILEFTMDVHADVTEQDYVGGSLTLRESNNSATGNAVPYLPSEVISGMYTHRFPFNLTVGTTLKLNSSQYADAGGVKMLRAFILADVLAEYNVMSQLTVSFGLTNLFNQPHRWWDGYAGMPRTAAVSASYMW